MGPQKLQKMPKFTKPKSITTSYRTVALSYQSCPGPLGLLNNALDILHPSYVHVTTTRTDLTGFQENALNLDSPPHRGIDSHVDMVQNRDTPVKCIL